MQNHHPHRRRLAIVVLVAVTVVCISPPGLAQSDARLGAVYYQVLYADRQLRDLPKIPDTNKGIRSVLRIATVGSAKSVKRRSKTLSTKRPTAAKDPLDRTHRTQLSWNGRAWIGSPTDRTRQLAKVLTTTDLDFEGHQIHHYAKPHPLVGSWLELQNRQAFWQLAAIDIEAKMFEHAGTHTARKKRWDLAAVEAIQRNMDRSIEQHRKAAKKLGRDFRLPNYRRVKPLGPTGKIVAAKAGGKWTTAAGIEKPIDEVHILPHRLQVWAAPHQTGRRRYHVSMAHAEAGTFGAFYYVVYADSTGDGVPDKPIARSALARSDKPGKWTSWSFTTEAERVFIGHTWPGADTAIYCRRAPQARWRQLGSEVYVAPVVGMPPRQSYGPYISNLRVYFVSAPLEPTTQPTTKPDKKPANR